MKDDLNKKDHWTAFRKIFDCINTNEDAIHTSLLQLAPALDSFLDFAPTVVFIIDYSTMKYLYFNARDYAGSIAENYLNGGVEFSISNNHPDDMEIILGQVFPYIRKFLSELPHESYKDYKFSFNFRYKRKDGTYQHFVQHSTYLPDKAGNLRYNFAMGSNLPNADKIKITLTIEKKEKGKENYKQVLIETVSADSLKIFTKRECEILTLLYKGLSSVAIADKLCLSEHTVNNHRKKMLQKSGAANTAALLSYAKEKGFI